MSGEASTERLYQADAYATEFESRVAGVRPCPDGWAVILDATLFYPETGGQPCDTGSLAGAGGEGGGAGAPDEVRIERVVEEGDTILHIVGAAAGAGSGAASEPAGQGLTPGHPAKGRIDWPRRFTNMQQHTGQHILSQAFLRVLGAATISSRLGLEHSTIDVGKLNLTWEDMERTQQVANSVVFEDRPVAVRLSRPEDAGDLRAKKALPSGLVRLVDVEDFDVVPCGGTHCRRTGEVGLIEITGWEKVRDTTRVEFVCGKLAEADYFWKTRELADLAKAFTTGIDKVPALVRDLSAASQTLRRDLARARAKLAEQELAELAARARTVAGVRVVSAVLEGVEPASLRGMAARLTAEPSTVALLGSRGERIHFVFARSSDVAADMRDLLKAALAVVKGKGGGRSEAAEGGGAHADRVDQALAAAVALLYG